MTRADPSDRVFAVSFQAHRFTLEHFAHVMHDRQDGPGIDAALMSVAQAVAFYADQHGRAIRMSVSTLARQLGKEDRNIQRVLRKLEEHGWLRCTVRSVGGRGRPSQYEILPMVEGINPGADATVLQERNGGTGDRKPRHAWQETVASVAANPGVGATRSEESVRNHSDQRVAIRKRLSELKQAKPTTPAMSLEDAVRRYAASGMTDAIEIARQLHQTYSTSVDQVREVQLRIATDGSVS